MAETKIQAIKEAQELADLYHCPYYVCRGRFTKYTVSAVGKQGRTEVLPKDGKIESPIIFTDDDKLSKAQWESVKRY